MDHHLLIFFVMMHGAIRYAAVGMHRFCLSAATFPVFFFSFELSDCILQCLNDGTPDVRDSAFSVLAAVAKVVFPFKKNIENLLLHF
jgi:hypothetical protein